MDPESSPPAASTRERVLELALGIVRERGDAEISLVGLAARAGLSRQTLYLLFGSRAGLLMAMVDHLDGRSRIGERFAAMRTGTLTPSQALEPYVRIWFAYLPEVFPVARALSVAAARGDTAAAAAWRSRLDKLRTGFTQMMRGLQATGALKPPWTPDTATDWMLALTHIDLWQHLVVESGWTPEAHIERIVGALRATLLIAPDETAKR